MVMPLFDHEHAMAKVEQSIGSNSRQLLGTYVTEDGLYDIHLTATLQGASPYPNAGPYPRDIVTCSGCEADIVWMKTRTRKRIPVNVMPTETKFRGPKAGELKFVVGEHQCHFDTCTK